MANEVEAARAELSMSRAQFADALGVHRTTVNRWELGKPVPEPESRLIQGMLERHRALVKRRKVETAQ